MRRPLFVIVISFIGLGFLFWSSWIPIAQAIESENGISLSVPSSMMPWPEEAHGERRWSGDWWMGTSGHSFTEGVDDGAGVKVKLGSEFRYDLSPWARFLLDGEAQFFSSRVQTRYDTEIMESGLRLREGYLEVGKTDQYGVQVGALRQQFLRSQLLISGKRAFPGIKEYVAGALPGSSQIIFLAQQSLPTSYTLNTGRTEKETMPTFLTETLEVNFGHGGPLGVRLYGTHYQFHDLPSVVAFKSGALGNVDFGTGSTGLIEDVFPSQSKFVYGFNGFMLGSEFCWCQLKAPLVIGGQWLQNNAAPRGLNRGQMIFVEAEFNKSGDVVFKPFLGRYFSEPYVTPAYYARWELGNTNRQGQMASLEVEFRRYGFKVEVEYVEASVLNANPFQFDKRSLTIGVETNHVPF